MPAELDKLRNLAILATLSVNALNAKSYCLSIDGTPKISTCPSRDKPTKRAACIKPT